MAEGQLFYIQKAGFVGNSMLWWKKGDAGYSPDIKEARMFWKSEAEKICSQPHSDKTMWPKDYIDTRISHEVDMQYCDHEKAMLEED